MERYSLGTYFINGKNEMKYFLKDTKKNAKNVLGSLEYGLFS